MKLLLSFLKSLFSLSLSSIQLGNFSGVLAVQLLNLLDKFFFLGFKLLLIVLFLIDKLLDELINVLVHPVYAIIFCSYLEPELAYSVLLRLQLLHYVVNLRPQLILFV